MTPKYAVIARALRGLSMEHLYSGHWIDGQELESLSKDAFECENLTTGKPEGRFALGAATDIDYAVGAAKKALVTWKAMSPTRRGRLLMRWVKIAQEQGEIGVAFPADLLARQVTAMVQSLALRARSGADVLEMQQTASILVQLIMTGAGKDIQNERRRGEP